MYSVKAVIRGGGLLIFNPQLLLYFYTCMSPVKLSSVHVDIWQHDLYNYTDKVTYLTGNNTTNFKEVVSVFPANEKHSH